VVPEKVEQGWAEETAHLLKALADPTRLSMFSSLLRAGAEICVCDFTAVFNLSQPTISHHMGKLRSAGLVSAQKRGIWSYYRVSPDLAPETLDVLRVIVASAPAA